MEKKVSEGSLSDSSCKSVLGIDAGSTRIKGALWTGSSWLLHTVPSTVSYEQSIGDLISTMVIETGLNPDEIVATGYGRKMVPGASGISNEIGCHGKGATYLVPGCRTVIDIGGQDAKVISVQEKGKVTDFSMNDKCAAGTGRFLSILADTLNLSLSDLGNIGTGIQPLRLSSMCTVFAESEVIGLLSQGYPIPEIVAGINDAIARRTVSLASRLSMVPVITFTGGVSANTDIVSRISELISLDITVPDHAEYSGAIGSVISVCSPEPWSLTQIRTI
ncbi:MAG: acyl-CoA dehydratase activase [Methanospirillum sp.]|uniref:acyl-CoA dehydratase activase n=1 Tax=Methanospirillum sp. TaxID=45200 RepID=UPI00236E37BE|nr:acyl-CoA dehydratase activase [Methanospirillum sp.]MDD1728328.1 acyl-CoA dehydratase activase [Methanospirillum sp.]